MIHIVWNLEVCYHRHKSLTVIYTYQFPASFQFPTFDTQCKLNVPPAVTLKAPCSAYTMYLYVSYLLHSKEQLIPKAALNGWYLEWSHSVYYEVGTELFRQTSGFQNSKCVHLSSVITAGVAGSADGPASVSEGSDLPVSISAAVVGFAAGFPELCVLHLSVTLCLASLSHFVSCISQSLCVLHLSLTLCLASLSHFVSCISQSLCVLHLSVTSACSTGSLS